MEMLLEPLARLGPTAIACGVVFLLVSGCSRQTVPSSEVLAKVGQHEITLKDFEREIQWRRDARLPLPGRQQLLNEMINRELHLQKARAEGLENNFDVRRRYEDILARAVEKRDLMPRLAAVRVSSEEVQGAYHEALTRYTRAAKIHLALICIKRNSRMTPEKVAELEARIQEARQRAVALPSGTRGFGVVAVNYSEDQASRYRGGDVGWFDQEQPEYRWPKAVVAAGFALKNQGDISPVVEAPNGFYLVMKLDSRKSTVVPLAQVQGPIRRRLLEQKRHALEVAFQQSLRTAVSIQTFPRVLAGAAYPTTTLANAAQEMPPAFPGSP
jgi:PPIC-type PPIASE domain